MYAQYGLKTATKSAHVRLQGAKRINPRSAKNGTHVWWHSISHNSRDWAFITVEGVCMRLALRTVSYFAYLSPSQPLPILCKICKRSPSNSITCNNFPCSTTKLQKIQYFTANNTIIFIKTLRNYYNGIKLIETQHFFMFRLVCYLYANVQ